MEEKRIRSFSWNLPAKGRESSAEVFCEFEILSLRTSLQHAGWTVRKHVRQSICPLRLAVEKCHRKVRNSAFHRGVESHSKVDGTIESEFMHTALGDKKSIIAGATASA